MTPIASLTRVEILDTPGFNAPDQAHTEAARSAFEEADAAMAEGAFRFVTKPFDLAAVSTLVAEAFRTL